MLPAYHLVGMYFLLEMEHLIEEDREDLIEETATLYQTTKTFGM